MSEQQIVATPAATPVTETKPRVSVDDLPPEALKARLDSAKEQARREFLSELGVADTKDAKAALAELKARQDAEKSELEKARSRVAELEGQAAKATHAEQIAARRVAAELSGLTDGQRAYVTKTAGEDPLRQLETIDAMREAGLLTSLAPAAQAQAAATAESNTPAAPPVPASTAPAPSAPQQGTVSSVDHAAVFDKLRQQNPFAAAGYAQRHNITPSR